MNEKPKIKLKETVVLVDAAYLNYVMVDMKGHFEETIGRSLSLADLPVLTIGMTLDAGITEGKNEIQFFFIYDNESSRLVHCQPSDLKEELNGVAFECPYGEYLFASVPSEGLVSREQLFLDLLSIVSDSADVERIIVASFNEEYGDEVTKALNAIKDKEVFQHRMDEPVCPVSYEWDMLAFPIMQAWGIRPDELD